MSTMVTEFNFKRKVCSWPVVDDIFVQILVARVEKRKKYPNKLRETHRM